MQDSQVVSEAVTPISPTGVKPTLSPKSWGGPSISLFWTSQMNFFWTPLYPDSEYIFFFEWRDPDTLEATQYTWTVLLQDLGDSPHLFGKAFTRELSLVKGTLLQYVDDLLKLIRELPLFSLFSRTQASGVKTDPVQLNSVALRWPSCLCAGVGSLVG